MLHIITATCYTSSAIMSIVSGWISRVMMSLFLWAWLKKLLLEAHLFEAKSIPPIHRVRTVQNWYSTGPFSSSQRLSTL
jgi:hypothetical protein